MDKVHLTGGEVFLGGDIASFSGAVVNVFLLDTSLTDAPSKVIARQTTRGISHEKGKEHSLPFELYGEKLDKRFDYTVRVHISLHGSEEVKIGDFITMESYLVLSLDDPTPITIKLQEVK